MSTDQRATPRESFERFLGRFVTLLSRARSSALARLRQLPTREARVDRVVRDRDRPRTLNDQLAPARSERPASGRGHAIGTVASACPPLESRQDAGASG